MIRIYTNKYENPYFWSYAKLKNTALNLYPDCGLYIDLMEKSELIEVLTFGYDLKSYFENKYSKTNTKNTQNK